MYQVKIDGVFEGGGVRAFAFIGALEQMESKGITFERLAGTSAGALFASLIKAGYSSNEILAFMEELDLLTLVDAKKSFLPIRFLKWISVYYTLGLYKGDKLESWIATKLKQKGIETFGDIPEGTLKIVATDLTKGRLLVLPDDLPSYGIIPESFSVARAIRMSASIPYFYRPVKLYDKKGEASIIVDGGVLSNFPIWLFMKNSMKRQTRPVIGFRLTPILDEIPPNKITNAFVIS